LKTLIAQAVGVFLVLALCFTLGYSYRDYKADKETLTLQNNHLVLTEQQRDHYQGELNAISQEWQERLKDAEGNAKRTIAGLRTDGYRLRIELADATVCSVTGDCGPEPDGRAELHPRAAEFLVGQAQRADAQVGALQATIRQLQSKE
jgi:uncharacterized membrane protein